MLLILHDVAFGVLQVYFDIEIDGKDAGMRIVCDQALSSWGSGCATERGGAMQVEL